MLETHICGRHCFLCRYGQSQKQIDVSSSLGYDLRPDRLVRGILNTIGDNYETDRN